MTQEARPKPERHTFKDSQDRTWDVTLNLAAAKRIDAMDYSEITDKKFTILEPDKELFMLIMTDTNLLFAIIWAMIQPQVKDQMGIDPVENFDDAEQSFLESLDGPAIQSGREAVWGAVADFFPDQQTALSTLMRQFKKANERLRIQVQGLEPELEAVMNAEMDAEMKNLRNELKRVKTPA